MNERQKLHKKYKHLIEVNPDLNRRLVSAQANKNLPFYRWFRYKEGFSRDLVHYFIAKYHPQTGKLLDPFAGMGTSLYAGAEKGWECSGFDMMPIGPFISGAYRAAINVTSEQFATLLEIPDIMRKDIGRVSKTKWSQIHSEHDLMSHPVEEKYYYIPIIDGAFPEKTKKQLDWALNYLWIIIDNEDLRWLFQFAVMSVLEEISYTSKDGSYLRWDSRSSRGGSFEKKAIADFPDALEQKLKIMYEDLGSLKGCNPVKLHRGDAMGQLSLAASDMYDFVITSPPYCNRYDYTRTYALELVYLGEHDLSIKDLRQNLISSTVENREKDDYLRKLYRNNDVFSSVMDIYHSNKAMAEVNSVMSELKKRGKLNNGGVPRMVKNYFIEMGFVIYELHRTLKKGGYCVMVNDNVQYAGEEVPVDLLLSSLAESFGFAIEKIWALPKGKGNSSQQMDIHGRNELRKCVYVWRK